MQPLELSPFGNKLFICHYDFDITGFRITNTSKMSDDEGVDVDTGLRGKSRYVDVQGDSNMVVQAGSGASVNIQRHVRK